ncbi:glutamate-gated chloride channel alpha-like [Artemia franciscana]|uniref:glutamate-gated chloride channel alpha-like n=1 Tax=Artemia franciscana TaxID=6661 RepID=UPI0032DA8B58
MKRKKELRVPFYLTKCFWTPSFYFPEVAGSEQREQIMFSIQPNGSIRTTSLISLKIPYDDNLHVYPFDVLSAKFTLVSYSYSGSLSKFYWVTQTILYGSELSEFKLLGIDVGLAKYQVNKSFGNVVRDTAWVKVNLARYPQLPIMSIYLPALIVVISSWLVFLLPDREAGTKLSIGVTSFLTLLTITAYAEKQIPRTPFVRGHDLFFGFCFAAMFFSLFAHIQNRLHCIQDVVPCGKPKRKRYSAFSCFVLSLLFFNAVYWPSIMYLSGYL